jgi:hypothetical protein
MTAHSRAGRSEATEVSIMRRHGSNPSRLRPVLSTSRRELDPNEWAVLTLPDEHPVPWYYQEETEGGPVPWHYRDEPDAYTDDARRCHVVRDAKGDIIIHCARFSKSEEEKLARAIASIPNREAEITRLRARVAELDSAITKLYADFYAALKAAATRSLAAQQNDKSDDARMAIAAKQIIEADYSLLAFAQLLTRTANLQIDRGDPDTAAPEPHPAS